MSDVTALAVPPVHGLSSFDDIVDALDLLTRRHALAFRLQVGAVLLSAFYEGDIRAYRDRSPAKELRFDEFLRERKDTLDRMGLSAHMARRCIRAHAVWRTLPPSVRDGLGLGQLDVLTRLGDPSARTEVASAALRHGWSLRQLTDAVDTVRGGGVIDEAALAVIEGGVGGDAGPGDDAESSAPPLKGTRQPGRLVREAERWVQGIDGWQQRWATVDVAKLRPAQRQRVLDATLRLERQVVELRRKLAVAARG